ncbi:hypothetical protein E9993_14770 [Labilibacter sediminis]|nr:hypothetical protein E9993_14770 [Labilibacter sediminis]
MSKYIDQQEILRETNAGLDVFQYYFNDVDFHNPRHKFKIRSDEKTPSANCKLLGGQWRITDFGNQTDIKGLNCIDWVKYHEGLQYIDALKFIMDVIIKKDISGGDYKKPVYQAEYSWREVGQDDHKGMYKWVFKEDPLDSDLETIGRYVTIDHLQKLHGKVVESYEFVSYSKKYEKDIVHQFKATPDYPIFLFDYGSFQKLYKPHEIDKKFRFLYIGEKPTDFIYGLDILQDIDQGESDFLDEDKGDYKPPEGKPEAVVKNLFRVSGESDALNMISLGYHVYFLNSESATFDKSTYNKLDRYCEKHYQIMDLDKTGFECARTNALKHMNLFTMQIPKWIQYKKDWRGNACKDMKDFINLAGKDEDGTRGEITKLVRRAKPMKFWEKTTEQVKGKTKVNYNINLEYYYFFMQMHGFYCMNSKYHKKAGYCYAKVEGKTVTLIHPDDIKRIAKTFTKEWIRSRNLIDEIAILNKINSSNQISENNLQELAYIEPCFDNYSQNYETLVFKNGALKITKDKIERIKHADLNHHILGELTINNEKISHVIDHNIRHLKESPIMVDPSPEYAVLLKERDQAKTPNQIAAVNTKINALEEWKRYNVTINDKDFMFAGFLRDLSRIHWRKTDEQKQELSDKERGEENQLLANLMFFIGYQCQQYKDPGKPWMGFLQDMKISAIGKSSGRSGKSLLSTVIKKVRPSFYVPGRNKDVANDQFIFDGYTRFHNNIEVDDLHEFADIDFFYTQITGPRRVNNKHLSPETLQYDLSGKMFVSTNFELPNTDNSTLARLLFVAVSDYYHESTKYNDYKETRSPLDKYGRRLFDDFTEEEWVKFYNLVAYCIQMVMRFPGKIHPPMENLEKRQLRRAMIKGVTKDEEFYVWANSYYLIKPKDVRLQTDFSPNDHGYLDTMIIKEVAFQNFKSTLSDTHQRKYTAQQFKKATQAWCEYYGYEFNPASRCNLVEQRKITKKVDGKTQECFYISSDPNAELTKQEADDLPF